MSDNRSTPKTTLSGFKEREQVGNSPQSCLHSGAQSLQRDVCPWNLLHGISPKVDTRSEERGAGRKF